MKLPEKKKDPGYGVEGRRRIVVGHTKLGAEIQVCDRCEYFGGHPHFSYYLSTKKLDVPIEFERAVPLDNLGNLELKYRRDLEDFFAMIDTKTGQLQWKLAVECWNKYNDVQISPLLHKPNYMNLIVDEDRSMVSCRDGYILCGCEVYVSSFESESHPHFHVRRPNGIDVAISILIPAYMKPSENKLSRQELNGLIEFLKRERKQLRGIAATGFQEVIWHWNNVNQGWDWIQQISEDTTMPDYSFLEVADLYEY